MYMENGKWLFPYLQAANYLNIKSLLDLGCLTVANMIKGEDASFKDRTLHKDCSIIDCSNAEVGFLCHVTVSDLLSPGVQTAEHSACFTCATGCLSGFKLAHNCFSIKPCLLFTGKTPEEIRKTFNIPVAPLPWL
jgi:hypothetical protein